MHEMSLAQEIIQILHEQLKTMDLQKVIKVRVSVGALLAVERESLNFAYKVLAEDTPLKDSNLEIIEEPVMASCRKCGNTYKVENYSYVCPKCKNNDFTIVEGNKMYIKEVEVE